MALPKIKFQAGTHRQPSPQRLTSHVHKDLSCTALAIRLLSSVLKPFRFPKGISYHYFLALWQLEHQLLEGSLWLRELLIWTEPLFLVILVTLVQQPEHPRTLGSPGSTLGFSGNTRSIHILAFSQSLD